MGGKRKKGGGRMGGERKEKIGIDGERKKGGGRMGWARKEKIGVGGERKGKDKEWEGKGGKRLE